jgi:Mg2+ and Co2+ transporter CorA
MTDASPVPPLDNHHGDSEHEAIVARIVRLEVNAEYTTKTLELMQRRMDDGFKQLTEEIAQLRTEMRTELSGLRTEMRTEISDLRREMITNLRWLMGVQITTVIAVMGILAKMANFF